MQVLNRSRSYGAGSIRSRHDVCDGLNLTVGGRFDNYAGQILARTPLIGAGFQQASSPRLIEKARTATSASSAAGRGSATSAMPGPSGVFSTAFMACVFCSVLGAWPWAGSR